MNDIHHEITSQASTNAAYAALTTPEGLRGWWARDCDISEGVGAEHELRFAKDDRLVAMRFRVEALEPDRLVRWSCVENGNPAWVGSTLEWRLEAGTAGSTIRFEHGGFAAGGPPYEMTVQGWTHFTASLQRLLDTGTGEPW
jgi:uncharacterized protein YndB with AHSA1/START domain